MLAGWTGWGSLSPSFAPDVTGGWAEIAEEVTGLLTGRQLHTASTSLDVSFFTPRPVIDAVFDILAASGFTGGRVLEPGCGTGAFMHHAPAHLDLDVVGVERDETSALIAGLLARTPASSPVPWKTPTCPRAPSMPSSATSPSPPATSTTRPPRSARPACTSPFCARACTRSGPAGT